MRKSVAILGGGVGGLTAAHELLERGFDVTIYERDSVAGGKARGYPKTGSGKDGRRDLPGEHGFRMLPGFYKHLPDTMKRIPFANQQGSVLGNLVETERLMISSTGISKPLEIPSSLVPKSVSDLRTMVRAVIEANQFDIAPSDTLFFLSRLFAILTACDQRRYEEFDNLSWWEFVGAAERSRNYQRYYAIGPTRTMVACQAEKVSARTGGVIGAQLALGPTIPGSSRDRVLNGPTDEVWIRPWLDYLRGLGLRCLYRRTASELRCDGKIVTGVEVLNGETGQKEHVTADFYIAAVPLEVMKALTHSNQNICSAEPKFAELHMLNTARMSGIQFYLKCDAPIVRGQAIYLDSAWALTSVSQQQFWRSSIGQDYGDGSVGGILSVDISDWDAQCPCHQRCAKECSSEEIAAEVWSQLKNHLNQTQVMLDDANLAGYYLDRGIRASDTSPCPDLKLDLEPLLINTAGSWKYRPQAVTGIANLFLASDYVQTHTDLATMEGANEAARRAVNAILDASGSTSSKCPIWPLLEPAAFQSLRQWDSRTFRSGYDGVFDGPPSLLFVAAAGEFLDFASAVGKSIATMIPPFLRDLPGKI